MMRRFLIYRYIFLALIPYTALALIILTVILLTQQTAKFSDVLGNSGAPLQLIAGVTISLIPNILIFTLPMAVLVGTATGYSRMGYDSELVAMNAAGVGTLSLIRPALFLGALISILTLYTGFGVAPPSAQNLRDVGLRAALYRLESPVEPKTFYTGMPGKVIYVREGDRQRGQWGNIFIHWQEQGGQLRLISARGGRLDFSGEQTELVLEDALVTTLPSGDMSPAAGVQQITIERSKSLRVRDERLDVSRGALIRRVREREPEMDEMGWSQLRSKSASAESAGERRDAALAFHKRLSLCLAPLVFTFFGAGLGLRSGRRGRSYGLVFSLAAMLLYYFVSLAGEQMGRANLVPPQVGAWMAFALAAAGGILLLLLRRRHRGTILVNLTRKRGRKKTPGGARPGGRPVRFLGLLDRAVTSALLRNFLLSFVLLVCIIIIFTFFELLRFIVPNQVGASTVAAYFFYLLPLVSVSVAPVSVLLAALISFALMVRSSEAVAWWASGQSAFRLVLPALILAGCFGLALWVVQERILPVANRQQNNLRALIRGGVSRAETPQGRVWYASADTGRLISFERDQETGEPRDLSVFEFNEDGLHLERVILSAAGRFTEASTIKVPGPAVLEFSGASMVSFRREESLELAALDFQVLNAEFNRPAELNSAELSAYIKALNSRGADVRSLAVALERKRAEPFAPLILAIVGSPLALSFGRRGTLSALGVAVAAGLAFFGASSFLQQLGANGLLPPALAAWAPSCFFGAIGLYLLSKTRT